MCSKQPSASNVIRVKLTKNRKHGLGFLIRARSPTPNVVVSDLVHCGIAAECGLVQIGDVILKVNEHELSGFTYEQSLDLLKKLEVNSSVVLILKGQDGYTSHLETRFSDDGTPRTIRITRPCAMQQDSFIGRLRKTFLGSTAQRNYRSRQLLQVNNESVRSHSEPRGDGDRRIYSGTDGDTTVVTSGNPARKRSDSDSCKILTRVEIRSQDACIQTANDSLQWGNTNTVTDGTISISKRPNQTTTKNVEIRNTKAELGITTNKEPASLDLTKNETTVSDITAKTNSSKNGQENLDTEPVLNKGLFDYSPLTYANTVSEPTGEGMITRRVVTEVTLPDKPGECDRNTIGKQISIVEIGPIGVNEVYKDTGTSGPTQRPTDSELKTKAETLAPRKMSTLELDTNNPGGILARRRSSQKGVKLRNVADERPITMDTLHASAIEPVHCTKEQCMGSLMDVGLKSTTPRHKDDVMIHAKDFIAQYYGSIKRHNTPAHTKRWEEVERRIESTGAYELTVAELTFGAKTAWRNAQRCIGRIQWSKLQVFDARHITTARGMFEAICNHIKYGTNKGNIRSAITVFPPRTDGQHDFRVWNDQLIRYAGYRQDDGSVVGDPANVDITQICEKMGWKGKGTRFDVLPLVLQANGHDPELFEIPCDLVLEVAIRHPRLPWFADMGLKWYAVPAVSCLVFDCGGLEFTCAPFNGWYMGTEIGARDFCDKFRYNLLKDIATRMGFDTRKSSSLWRDRTLVEVNVAVLHSFQTQGVTITDHHTAAESFMKHLDNEQRLRGGCPADWVWVVPPMSGSILPVFHQEMLMYKLKPNYEYQESPWKTHIWTKDKETIQTSAGDKPRRKIGFRELARAVKFSAKLMVKALARRVKCIVLYGTETGKSTGFAKTLCQIFRHAFDAKVMSMDDYDIGELEHEALVLIVTSTFGNGDPPESGETFARALFEMKHPDSTKNKQDGQTSYLRRSTSSTPDRDMIPPVPIDSFEDNLSQETGPLSNVRYSVFGLGSSAYPNFCAFGHYLDNIFYDLSAERIYKMMEGDELCGQEESFKNWAQGVFKAACETFCVGDDNIMANAVGDLSKVDNSWTLDKFRVTLADKDPRSDTISALSNVHGKSIIPCKFLERVQLQSDKSERQTLLIRLDTQGSSELLYNPGDHVAIFPENSSKLVDAILIRLYNAPPADQPIKLEIYKERVSPFGGLKSWEEFRKFSGCSLRTAFSKFLDITTPPTQTLLKSMASQAAKDCDRQCLENLANDTQLYDEWKHAQYPNIVHVLDQFPSLKIPPSLLLSQLPLLQQRYYSISSSAKCYPGEIHSTVAIVSYTKGTTIHDGVCSSWLNRLPEGSTVPCLVRHAPAFQMPEDGTRPMILVGPGTGIAPFRSFWQQRKIDMDMDQKAQRGSSQGWGDMYLYFGCRRSDMDNIYMADLQLMKKERVLKEVYTALSREPDRPTTYVQHILLKNAADTFRVIVQERGHFYVCGDVKMASDVTATLENILMTEGGMSAQDANNYVLNLRDSYRFHEDIFGVTLRNSEVTDKARDQARKAWNSINNSNRRTRPSIEKETVSPIPDDDKKAPKGKPKPPQKFLYNVAESTKL